MGVLLFQISRSSLRKSYRGQFRAKFLAARRGFKSTAGHLDCLPQAKGFRTGKMQKTSGVCLHCQSSGCFVHPELLTKSQDRRPKSIHQYCAKGSPTNTLKPLWCICIFLLFPFKTGFLVYTSFLPGEELEFSELKTPLVYTFSFRQVGR